MTDHNQYSCGRCGFSTSHKCDLISHLKRKKVCPPTLKDIATTKLLEEIQAEYDKKPFACEYCGNRFKHKNHMYVHRKTCKSKPSSTQPQIQTGDITINGDHNTVTINQTFVHINPIDYANTSYLTTECLDELIRIGGKRNGNIDNAIIRAVRMIFCNLRHPENYGVYIPNKKEKNALVHLSK